MRNQCDHKVMIPQQHYDECAQCGARWHPVLGWNVPLPKRAKFRYSQQKVPVIKKESE